MGRFENIIGAISPNWALKRQELRLRNQEYKAQTEYMRYVTDNAKRIFRRRGYNSHRGAVQTRTDHSWPGSYGQTGKRSPKPESQRKMRDRARQLVQNSYFAHSLLEASADHGVGTGTRIQPDTPDKDFNEEIGNRWRDYWYGDNGSVPDVRGFFDGPTLEWLWWCSYLRDGDIGAIFLDSGKLQTVEGDLISTPNRVPKNGQEIINGVQMTDFMKPTVYWMVKGEPLKRQWEPILAENFMWLINATRTSSVRGLSAFARSYALFEMLETGLESVTMAHNMAAMFGLVIKQSQKRSLLLGMNDTQEDAQGNTRPVFDMEPAMVARVEPGEEIEQIKPEHPKSGFEVLIDQLVRFSAREFSLPKEIALMVFTSSYSASRGALITANRPARRRHASFACRGIRRVYRWWLSREIEGKNENSDKLQVPAAVDRPWKHRALMDPHELMDPVKEVQAESDAVAAGFQTQGDVLTKRGDSIFAWAKRTVAEQQAKEDAGLKPQPKEPKPTDTDEEDLDQEDPDKPESDTDDDSNEGNDDDTDT